VRWWLLTLTCAGALATSAAPVHAHHPAPAGVGPQSALPQSRAGMDVEAAAFGIGRGGSWRAAAFHLEYAIVERLSLGLRVPIAHVRYNDGDTAMGPGDGELFARGVLWQTHDAVFSLVAGGGFEAPTGSTDDGLGGGHFMISPSLAAQFNPTREWSFMLQVADHISIDDGHGTHAMPASPQAQTTHDGSDHPAPEEPEPPGAELPGASTALSQPVTPPPSIHGSVLTPHSGHEMTAQLLATYQYRGSLYASAGPEAVVMWSGDERWGPLSLRSEVGVQPSVRLRVAAGADLPLVGQERLDWRARLGMQYLF
jgi:hypothetical protein